MAEITESKTIEEVFQELDTLAAKQAGAIVVLNSYGKYHKKAL